MNNLTKYTNYLKTRNLAPETIRTYLWTVSRYKQQLTTTKISQFLKNQVVKYQAWTIRNQRNALHSFAKYKRAVVDWELIARVIPKIQQKFYATISVEELEKLKGIDWRASWSSKDSQRINERNNLMLDFLFYTGIRVKELVNIKHSDYQNEQLKILGKGNKVRYIPLSPFLEQYFQPHSNTYLFLTRNGNKLKDTQVRTIIHRKAKRAGMKKRITPHTFRRSFATLLNKRKCSLTTIQKLLGHSHITTTTQNSRLQRRITILTETAKNYRDQIGTNFEANNLTKRSLGVQSLNNLPDLPQNANGTNNLSLNQLISGFEDLQDQLQTANTTITQAQTALRRDDLNHLPTLPTGKSLADLITAFNTPPPPPCSHPDYETIKNERDTYLQQRDNYQNQLNTHTCSPLNCPQPCCQGDYERLQQKLATQKKKMLQKLNNSLELGLTNQELSLKKVINKIEELLRNPLTELTQAHQTIKLLKKQLTEKDPDYQAIQQAEYQTLLQLVKEDTLQNCQKLGIALSPSTHQRITQATTLESLLQVRNNLIQNQFSKNHQELSQQKAKLIHAQHQEKWVWSGLLLLSYLVTIGLLLKLNKKKRIK